MLYRRHRIEVEREQAFERMRAQLALQQPKTPVVPHPWAREPRPDVFVHACLDHFAAIAPGGWDLDEYVCRASNVSYSWSRGGSNVAMLMAAEPRATIDTNGEHATYVEPLGLAPGGDEVLDGIHGVRLRMLSAFQLLGIALAFSPQSTAAPERSLAAQTLDRIQPGAAQPSVPPWQTWHMSAQLGEVRPDNVIKYLDEPGVRIETLSYKSGQWVLDGVLYEK
jgi:hypothetical protein